MKVIGLIAAVAVALISTAAAQTAPPKAPDITGQWTASFETQVGTQNYTFDFVVKDGKLTGKAKGNFSDAAVDIQDGKVAGDTVSFVENLSFQGMEIRITYTGKIASADEIKFTRQVADIASEDLVAKRVKK